MILRFVTSKAVKTYVIKNNTVISVMFEIIIC